MRHRIYLFVPALLALAACEGPAQPPLAIVVMQPTAVSQASTLVPGPPPPAQPELVPPPPAGAGSVAWQPGYWQWTGLSPQPWQWQSGRYVQAPAGQRIWVPGRWVQAPTGGWAWIEGHWAA